MSKELLRHKYQRANNIIHESQFGGSASYVSMGFILGQIEKVYIGACNACMARIGQDQFQIEATKKLVDLYDLNILILEQEVWIYNQPMKWMSEIPHSARWNILRAGDCGIPFDKIDPDFYGGGS